MHARILDTVLQPERQRRYMARNDFALPLLVEWPVSDEWSPILVSNSKGALLTGKPFGDPRSRVVRAGFFPCTLEEEAAVLRSAHTSMWQLSCTQGWGNRAKSVPEALSLLIRNGYPPGTLILSNKDYQRFSAAYPKDPWPSIADAEKRMGVEGFVLEIEGVRVGIGALAKGTGVLFSPPMTSGVYIRSDDCLALLFTSANRSIVLINENVA